MFKLLNSSCKSDGLTPDLIMGRVVVCLSGFYGDVQRGGAARLVAIDPRSRAWDAIKAGDFTFSVLLLGHAARNALIKYLSSNAYLVGRLSFKCSTVIGKNRAPRVVGFSSRAPSSAAIEILKRALLHRRQLLAETPYRTI